MKNKIFTMPQFLEKRYSPLVATMMAIFWLLVYVFVNLTSILYLGAIAISTISGFSFTACAVFIAIVAIIITLGGMKVIGYTDVIQVTVLVLGGLATTYLALDLVAQQFGTQGPMAGLGLLGDQAPGHFEMIFAESNPYYKDLPGLTVLIGGMGNANLNYCGCNQYITQPSTSRWLGGFGTRPEASSALSARSKGTSRLTTGCSPTLSPRIAPRATARAGLGRGPGASRTTALGRRQLARPHSSL